MKSFPVQTLSAGPIEEEGARQSYSPRLFLLDACSLRTDLGRLAMKFRGQAPGSKFLALLAPEEASEEEILRLFNCGIDGFVKLHRTWQSEVPLAIQSLARGQPWVPPEVLVAYVKQAKALLDALGRSPLMTATAAPAVKPQEVKLPLERIKRNYDEASFRRLAFELENLSERKLAGAPPREHAVFHVERGRDLLNQGFVGEAESQFREAILLDPANAAAHLGLARLLAADKPSDARAEVRSALVLQPSAEAWLVLAQLDLRDNNMEAARQDVDHALELEPSNVAAMAMKRDITSRLSDKSRTPASQ
jgi:tetratricopeptide (TPR) repeat protein